VDVNVDVPVDSLLAGSIWVGLGALLVPFLFLQQRAMARREAALYSDALTARDATLERARSIQSELEKVQSRLSRLEPVERAHVEEIATLERERSELEQRLKKLAQREQSVRHKAARFGDLDREREALEDLLDEAVQDLEQKDGEISSLTERLNKAAKAPTQSSGGRARGAEQLGKRMRTLYPALEFDARAIDDIVGLGDETLRLRAEEALKRLESDQDNATVRRKVGGLPAGLSIFELGFAGKGRIYYTRAKGPGFRVLAVGGKASQKTDLDYLRKLDLK
jgi:DNA repair exonuclease SbcCD ATPase subunit